MGKIEVGGGSSCLRASLFDNGLSAERNYFLFFVLQRGP
jgi:hypothetical protein